eukprot:scaffold101205_cov60-Phaeocystis_antarctica.AAC.1
MNKLLRGPRCSSDSCRFESGCPPRTSLVRILGLRVHPWHARLEAAARADHKNWQNHDHEHEEDDVLLFQACVDLARCAVGVVGDALDQSE